MDVPSSSQPNIQEDIIQENIIEEHIIASLYKDINNSQEDIYNQLITFKPTLYAPKLGITSNKNLTLSIANSSRKANSTKNITFQAFEGFQSQDEINLFSNRQGVNKDDMDSPTFFKAAAAAAENKPDNPFFRSVAKLQEIRSETPQNFSKQIELSTHSNDINEAVKDVFLDRRDSHNHNKVANMLEEYKNRKALQNEQSLNGTISLNTILELNMTRSKSITANEPMDANLDKLDSGFKDIQFLVHALGGLKDEKAGLKKDLEQPESTQNLGTESVVVLETIRSAHNLHTETERNHAEPISPSNIDESVEHMNANEFNEVQITVKKPENRQMLSSSNKLGTKIVTSANNQSKSNSPVKAESKKTGHDRSSTLQNMKVQSNREKSPKKVEVALMFDSTNKPICAQKISSLRLNSQPRESDSATKKMIHARSKTSATEAPNSARSNKAESRRDGKDNIISKSMFSKEAKIPEPTKVRKTFSKSLNQSPRRMLTEPAKTMKSSASGMIRTIDIKDASFSAEVTKYKKLTSPDRYSKRTEAPRPTTAVPNLKQESPKKAGPSKVFCYTEENEDGKNDLHEYLTEASIHPGIPEEVGPQIEVIEKNLRHIQEKSLFTSNNIRHVRYPSFGAGGIEKEQKISVRRFVSDEVTSQTPIEKSQQQQQNFSQHQNKLENQQGQQHYQQRQQEVQNHQLNNQKRPQQFLLQQQQQQQQQQLQKQQLQQHQQLQQQQQLQQRQQYRPLQQQQQQQPQVPRQQQHQPVQKPASPRTKMPHELLETDQTKIEKEKADYQNIPSPKKTPVEFETNPQKQIQLSHNSLMNSFNLRKNLSPQRTESRSSNQGTLPLTLDSSLDPLDQLPHSIYSGCVSSNVTPSKKVVDIYERTNQWLSSKQNKIQTLNKIRSTQEMKECTFKPIKSLNDNKSDSVSSQKSYGSYGLPKNSGTSSSPSMKRSVSKEKKILNSYNGFHKLKKEVGGSSSNDVSMSLKGSLYANSLTVTPGGYYFKADQR